MATHIDACFACRFRLPIAIGDSVLRSIDQVDPLTRSPLVTTMLSRMKAFQSFEEALDFVRALVLDGAPVILPIANGATLRGQSDPVGAGMAMVLDVFLAKGYEPAGFEQCDGFRVYRYKPFDEPAASPRT